jgi:2-methylcitrate dehydratase PrpD
MTFTDEMVTFIAAGQPPADEHVVTDWPAVRAAVDLAADRASSITDTAVAYAIGAAVADRVAAGLDSTPSADRWSRASVAGVIGAAAALGRLKSFDDQRLRHLLGLCATQATGLNALDGTETGGLQVAKAASDAVEAAVLVAHGFTSSADGLCGRRGLFALMAPGATPSGNFGWSEG